jgi:ABC-type multidrug transport system ATPase subunit
MTAPLLHVDRLRKRYARGIARRQTTFELEADFVVREPGIVGVMGPNGSGKTTLFELITGSNLPTSGHVRIDGQDVHRVRYGERDRLALHYHQSYQVRKFRRTWPGRLLERARSAAPRVHLFDEPQFNLQDGYVGFMLDFFRRLASRGRLVFVCLHPHEAWQLELLREICGQFIFVDRGRLAHAADFAALVEVPAVAAYLGRIRG